MKTIPFTSGFAPRTPIRCLLLLCLVFAAALHAEDYTFTTNNGVITVTAYSPSNISKNCLASDFNQLLGQLDTPGPSARTEAARALGNYCNPPQVQVAIKALARVMTNGWPQAEFEAARSLAKTGTPEAVEALLTSQRNSHSAEFRFMVNILLARKGHTNAVANLIKTLQCKPAASVGADAIARSWSPQHNSNLQDSELPRGASKLMAREEPAKATANLSRGMQLRPVADTFRRPPSQTNSLEQAFTALAERFAPLLDELTGSSLPYKLAAAETLGRLGNDQSVGGLRGALNHSDPEVRAAAAEALGTALSVPSSSLPPPVVSQTTDALGELSNDPAAPVRLAATNSLVRIRSSQSGVSKQVIP